MNQPSQPSAQEMQFQFTGTAKEYFGIWIVNILLTIITLGIYSAWAKVRTKRYFYGNTLLDGSPFDYLADPLAILKGWAIAVVVLIVYNVLTNVFPISALIFVPIMFIALPWVIVRAMRFRARNSAWRNIRFGFKKAYGEAARVFILFPLLMVVTLGLFLPYYYYAMSRFMVNNSGYGATAFQFHATAKDFYKVFLKPMLVMLVAIVIILALIAIPAYKEYQERARAAMDAQTMQHDSADMTAGSEEMSADEYNALVAEESAADIPGEGATTGTQDPAMLDESAPINSETAYDEQHAAMMEQAMRELANAEADLVNADVAAQQPTEMTLEDYQPETLAEGDVQVGILEPEGSGDEEYAGIELSPEESGMQTADASADAEDESSAGAGILAAVLGIFMMLLMFLFYMLFIAYIQSRTWNLLYNNTELAGHRFRSSIRARDIIWLYSSNLILIMLSFGLMIPWAKIRMARYRASKMQFLPAGNLENFMQAQQDKINALGEELGDVFDLDIGI